MFQFQCIVAMFYKLNATVSLVSLENKQTPGKLNDTCLFSSDAPLLDSLSTYGVRVRSTIKSFIRRHKPLIRFNVLVPIMFDIFIFIQLQFKLAIGNHLHKIA